MLDNIVKITGYVFGVLTVSGGSYLLFYSIERRRRNAEASKTGSEGRKVEFDIYDGTVDNWKDIVAEMRLDMRQLKQDNAELKGEVAKMQQNYFLKIAELETEQQENKKLKGEVGKLREQVTNLSTRLSKYEALPKEENSTTIEI